MKHEEIQFYITKTDNQAYLLTIALKEPIGLNIFKKTEYEKYAFKNYEELETWLKNLIKLMN